jgi:hypothetical protein
LALAKMSKERLLSLSRNDQRNGGTFLSFYDVGPLITSHTS